MSVPHKSDKNRSPGKKVVGPRASSLPHPRCQTPQSPWGRGREGFTGHALQPRASRMEAADFMGCFCFCFFTFYLFIFSTVQQGDPVTPTCTHSIFSHYQAPSQGTRQSSQCCTAGSHCKFIPKAIICIYKSQTPRPSQSLPLPLGNHMGCSPSPTD